MKSVLVLGAGMVSRPLVNYLLERGIAVTLGDMNREQAEKVIDGHPLGTALRLSADQKEELCRLIGRADLTVSLLPPPYHPQIAEYCLAAGKNFLTASYLSEEMKTLETRVNQKNLIFLNEIGLDPGLDHLTAMEMIDELKSTGYRILEFNSHCGGIPSRGAAVNPLRYKLSWSPVGVLGAITRAAKFRRGGVLVSVPGDQMLNHAEIIRVPGAGIFESTPNADSLFYGERYGLEEALTIRRGTLRYPGWAQFWLFILSLDLLNRERKLAFQDEQVLSALFKLAGREPPGDIFQFVGERQTAMASLILEIMEDLGLLDPDVRVSGTFSGFEILLQRAQERLGYQPGETDLVVLHHEFVAEKDGRKELWSSTMVREGVKGGDSAMALLVGLPAGIAARMILEGRIRRRGVLIPLDREIYAPILEELKNLGLPHTVGKRPLTV